MIITDGTQGFVGIGTNFYTPQSMLHIHRSVNRPSMTQYTNINTQTLLPQITDGFRVGIDADATAVLNQQENEDLTILVGSSAQPEQMRIVGTPGTYHGYVGIGNAFTDLMQPKRRLDVYDEDNFPQFRISQTIGTNTTAGIYADFQTTGMGNLLINPYSNGTPMMVGINHLSTTTLLAQMDVNGMACIRELPLPANEDIVALGANLDKIVAVNDDGVLYWRDATTMSNADPDWFDQANTGNPPTSINDNIYTFGNVAINGNSSLYDSKLYVYNVDKKHGIYIDERGFNANDPIGLFAHVLSTPVLLGVDHTVIGVFGFSEGNNFIPTQTEYSAGIVGYGKNAKTNIGVYGQNSGAGYAGYFAGNVVTSAPPISLSDTLIKQNIIPLNNSLDIINQLNPVSFNFDTAKFGYMNLPAGEQYGLLAQDVETVLPELVHSVMPPAMFDTLGNMTIDSMMFKGLNYIGLIPILTEGIKELNDITDSLSLLVSNPDTDWEKTNNGIVSGHDNNHGYNSRHVMVGTDINDLPFYPVYSKFTAYEYLGEDKAS
ncbi:MAG: tail fiber domain-containing protein, partial [Bacteroidota bacterium]